MLRISEFRFNPFNNDFMLRECVENSKISSIDADIHFNCNLIVSLNCNSFAVCLLKFPLNKSFLAWKLKNIRTTNTKRAKTIPFEPNA